MHASLHSMLVDLMSLFSLWDSFACQLTSGFALSKWSVTITAGSERPCALQRCRLELLSTARFAIEADGPFGG